MLSIREFEKFWHNIGDKSRINGNGYRVLVEIVLNGGVTTQRKFLERRDWNRTSVSKTFKRLYDEHFLYCDLDGREIVYKVNQNLFCESNVEKRNIFIDVDMLCKVWNVICEMSELSANSYRIFIDILLYGATTQKDLWERRGWKIAGVSATFRKLHDMNLLTLHEENGKKIYSANIEYILSKNKEE